MLDSRSPSQVASWVRSNRQRPAADRQPDVL